MSFLNPRTWLLQVRDRAAALLGLEPASFAPLAEDLQVVRYGAGGHFALHHDSSAAFQVASAIAHHPLRLTLYLFRPFG